MVNKINYTSHTVYCPISKKEELLPVQYCEENGKLLIAMATGCDKNYHECTTCNNCIIKATEEFKVVYKGNLSPL